MTATDTIADTTTAAASKEPRRNPPYSSKSTLFAKLPPDIRAQVDQALINRDPPTYQAVFDHFKVESYGASRTAFYCYARKIRKHAFFASGLVAKPDIGHSAAIVNLLHNQYEEVLMDDGLDPRELNSVSLAVHRATRDYLALDTHESKLRSIDAAAKTKAVVTMEKINNETFEAGYNAAIAKHGYPNVPGAAAQSARDFERELAACAMGIPAHVEDSPWRGSDHATGSQSGVTISANVVDSLRQKFDDDTGISPRDPAPEDAARPDRKPFVPSLHNRPLSDARDRYAAYKSAGGAEHLTDDAWELAMQRREAAAQAYTNAKGLPLGSHISISPTVLDLDPATSPPPEINDPHHPGRPIRAEKQLWATLMRKQFPADDQPPPSAPLPPERRSPSNVSVDEDADAPDHKPSERSSPAVSGTRLGEPGSQHVPSPWHPRDIPPRPRRPNPDDPK